MLCQIASLQSSDAGLTSQFCCRLQVRKSYDEHRRRRRARGQQRPWKLRRLDGADTAMQDAAGQQQRGRRAAQALAQGAGHDDDVERFLQAGSAEVAS